MSKRNFGRAAAALALAGSALLGLSGTAGAAPGAPFIGDGYANNTHAVWCVQHNLNYFLNRTTQADRPAPLAEDGLWGPQTKSAVQWLQAHTFISGRSLLQDGYVGQLTGNAIISDGDPYYVGSYDAYCWQYIPTTYGP
ncbi:peptidoglycan-binding protein [Kitasatospora sp. NPDC056076]|uniref:peptidoglycan-binding domain-containing protein n=1 Tax=Kitasatospora sp. NPDC056076 TaxID=3345703 RepID=UPI0035DAC59A